MRLFLTFCFIFLSVLLEAKTGLYRLVVTDNPSYAYTLAWVQFTGKNPVVWFAKKQNYEKTHAFSRKLSDVKLVQFYNLTHAFLHIDSLEPNTEYILQIQDQDSKSPLLWFKTLPAGPNARISIIAGGDSRTQKILFLSRRRKVRQKANKMVAKLQPDMVIFDGDFTNSDSPKQWYNWLEDWQLTIYDNRLIPIMVVKGNHEKNPDVLQNIFGIPSKDDFYTITIGNNFVRIIALNTDYPDYKRQTDWLIKQLQASVDATWTIVAYHKPIRPHFSLKPEGDKQYKFWAQPFFKYHVQLVLEGDTHTHKITWPIKPDPKGYQGFVRDDSNGTVYIGEGCWGAPLRPANDIKNWTRDAAALDQFKWLWISPDTIQIRTVLYKSVKNTSQLSADKPFSIPLGIKLRKTFDGKQVVLIKNYKSNKP